MGIMDSEQFKQEARRLAEAAAVQKAEAQARTNEQQREVAVRQAELARREASERSRQQRLGQLGGEIAVAAAGRVPYDIVWKPYGFRMNSSLIGKFIGDKVLAGGWILDMRTEAYQDDTQSYISNTSGVILMNNGGFRVQQLFNLSRFHEGDIPMVDRVDGWRMHDVNRLTSSYFKVSPTGYQQDNSHWLLLGNIEARLAQFAGEHSLV